MNNSYVDATMNNLEIGLALEDFVYGGKVNVVIPSLTPYMDKDKIATSKNKINKKNIMNKDVGALGLTECESCNYLTLDIPLELYRYYHICSKRLTYHGYKGEKFLIQFIGGDINQPVIIRRY